LRQCGHARRRHALKAGLTIVVRLTGPGALAHLHVATVRETLHVRLTRERDRRGLRCRARRSRGTRSGWSRARRIRLLLRIGLLGRGISRLLLLRVRLLLGVRLLPCGVSGLLLLVCRILTGLCRGRLLLFFAASPRQAQNCHARRGCTKRNLSHVVRLLGADPNAAGHCWSNSVLPPARWPLAHTFPHPPRASARATLKVILCVGRSRVRR